MAKLSLSLMASEENIEVSVYYCPSELCVLSYLNDVQLTGVTRWRLTTKRENGASKKSCCEEERQSHPTLNGVQVRHFESPDEGLGKNANLACPTTFLRNLAVQHLSDIPGCGWRGSLTAGTPLRANRTRTLPRTKKRRRSINQSNRSRSIASATSKRRTPHHPTNAQIFISIPLPAFDCRGKELKLQFVVPPVSHSINKYRHHE